MFLFMFMFMFMLMGSSPTSRTRTMISRFLLLLLLLFVTTPIEVVYGHVRWKCPLPRSPNTGIKIGPCGQNEGPSLEEYANTTITTTIDNNNTNTTELMILRPGPLMVVFEESIYHLGSPFRISLSGESTDDITKSCVLLDHIPHNDQHRPNPYINDEGSYVPYVVKIIIPNVSCQYCSLHLANPMTDKIGDDGLPQGQGCTDPNGTCFSVYHSCTIPFQIVPITDNEPTTTIPRTQYQCPYGKTNSSSLPLSDDWPTTWISSDDNTQQVDASIPGLYRRETWEWDSQTYTLVDVPSQQLFIDDDDDDDGVGNNGNDIICNDYLPSSSSKIMPFFFIFVLLLSSCFLSSLV